MPVAAKIAFATAGPIGATPGSPTPVGASPDGTMYTSTFGISAIRSTR
ncbi:isoquinoline 1-oxidoreductase, beta subunit domain protein [Burkholderia pseudomallei]|nr:isoquinoline 1-oxidoreductase, beta subunit domain protein [Burkholderia pseudomallei]